MKQHEAQQLIVRLYGETPESVAKDYRDSIAKGEGYKPRSWLQAVQWIAFGGMETNDVRKVFAKAER